MIKKLMQLVLMIMLVMGLSAASQAATITVGSATGEAGTQVSIPITIDDTAGRLDCSFSVSFDNTKLEYAGKTSGNMGASLLMASTADINAAGKVQPIVSFEEGGATSGTIVTFKFNIKTGAAAGVTPLTIGDITPTGTYTGVSGSVTITAAACTGPTITVGTDTACNAGDTVEIPITISDTAGRLDCSFAVSFDKTKLQYTGKTSGNMGASLLMASTADINAAGKVQPIVSFEDGGATSGTIVTFKFTLLAGITADLALPISDITPAGTYCGEDGAVEEDCAIPPTCSVTVSPQTATVLEGGTKTFTATTTGTGCAKGVYSWSVISSIGSTITAGGVYTAGSIASGTSATDTVTATDTANGNIKGSAVVTVIKKPVGKCTVNISPETATVDCGNEVQFTATTTGTGCATPVYTWNVTTTIGSTITQNGLYKAGTNQTGSSKTDIVRVTDSANSATDTSTVTVRDCTIVCVGLTPDITEGHQGQSLKLKLTTAEEIFKGVDKKDITVDFGSGITVVKISDKSNNSLKVEILIDAGATVGTRTILVTTHHDCAEGTFRVTPAPTLVITPLSGSAGTKIETVTITGVRTHFEKGKTKVDFGKKIDVGNVTVVSPGKLTCKIKIKSKAEVGRRTVTVSTKLPNKSTEVATGSFLVLPAPAE